MLNSNCVVSSTGLRFYGNSRYATWYLHQEGDLKTFIPREWLSLVPHYPTISYQIWIFSLVLWEFLLGPDDDPIPITSCNLPHSEETSHTNPHFQHLCWVVLPVRFLTHDNIIPVNGNSSIPQSYLNIVKHWDHNLLIFGSIRRLLFAFKGNQFS